MLLFRHITSLAALLVVFLQSGQVTGQSPDWQALRQNMAEEQVQARGISDAAVLAAMRAVPRHHFVPPGMKRWAYRDSPLSIGHGQTISQPYIVALMSEALEAQAGDKILEVGTGSGYQAAVLAQMGVTVYTVEIVEALAVRARQTLDSLGYEDIHTRTGDGYKGWPANAPFDGIIVTCSPSRVPPPLKNQLKPGGRVVIPVGPEDVQELVILTKKGRKFQREVITPVRFVPMRDKDGARY